MHPTELQKPDDKTLLISWSDGKTRRYSVRELRDRCPCATCREERTAITEGNSAQEKENPLAILSPQEARPLTLAGMRPVGNYAYGISFSDGHDTGIYTLDFLRELGEVE